jgi:O-antigen ligase
MSVGAEGIRKPTFTTTPHGVALEMLPVDRWASTSLVLLIGYFCLTRSFAYIGIPQWDVFLGEVVLACFLLLGPRTSKGNWLWVAMKAPDLRKLVRRFWLLFAYGAFEVFRGIYEGHAPFTSARDFAFDYYPLYFFLGLWVGLRSPQFLPRMIRALAWFNGIYGVLFILFLNRVSWTFPGVSKEIDPVPLLGGPTFSMVALLGLLVFEKRLRSVWYLFIMNLFVLLGIQLRGEWLAFAVALLLWSWLSKRLKLIAIVGAYLAILFALVFALNLNIKTPQGRGGGTVSAQDIMGRALAPINPDLASDYTDSRMAEGTAVWRAVWWAQIWLSVNAIPSRALLGYGYGYALGDLVPYLQGIFVRTPHNIFLYVLGYTGWIGVALFFAFQAEIAKLLWRAWKLTGQPFALLFWAAVMTFALFEPCFETPYGAIPFYLVIGCACAPILYSGKPAPLTTSRPFIRTQISGLASKVSG